MTTEKQTVVQYPGPSPGWKNTPGEKGMILATKLLKGETPLQGQKSPQFVMSMLVPANLHSLKGLLGT